MLRRVAAGNAITRIVVATGPSGQVTDGGALLSPSVTRRLVREFVSVAPRSTTPHPLLHTLTDREREVVGLVAGGLSNDEISGRRRRRWRTRPASPTGSWSAPATARTHVSRR